MSPIEMLHPSTQSCTSFAGEEEGRLVDLLVYLMKRLERIIQQVGTPQDTLELRANIQKLEAKCKETVNLYEQRYLAINLCSKEQLLRYRNALSYFESLLKVHNEKCTLHKPTTKASIHAKHIALPTPEEQQQLLLESSINENERLLLQERKKDIAKIHESVGLINEIFLDLGIIIQEQQHFVDSVELNIENATNRIHNANRQIFEASQTATRRRFYCCGMPPMAFFFIGLILFMLFFLIKA